MKMIYFPGAEYESFHAVIPDNMTEPDAVSAANAVIRAANYEDAVSEDGFCADGLLVFDSIARRLGELGFVLPSADCAVTLTWDQCHDEPTAASVPALA